MHGQAHQNKPPAGNGECLSAASAVPPSVGMSAGVVPVNHGYLPLPCKILSRSVFLDPMGIYLIICLFM